VNGLSASGGRLLVVLEEAAEKEKYSKFLGDLAGAYALCSVQLFWFEA
jgi:hypothetical protein